MNPESEPTVEELEIDEDLRLLALWQHVFGADDVLDEAGRDLVGLCMRLAYQDGYTDGVTGREPCAVDRFWSPVVRGPDHDTSPSQPGGGVMPAMFRKYGGPARRRTLTPAGRALPRRLNISEQRAKKLLAALEPR
jgi:hypothetical protein